MRRLVVVGMLALLVLVAPETGATTGERGWASAYAPGRMEEVVRWRLDTGTWRNPLPRGWYEAHGAIATNDCAQVGLVVTLVAPSEQEYMVLVADCGGADGGAVWMTENNIVAELDWRLWERLTGEHGRPLEVELR